MNRQFVFYVCNRNCNNSTDFARRFIRSVSVRTCSTNLHFRETNRSRFVKMLNTVIGGILVMSAIWRTETFESFSRASSINSSNCSLGTFLVSPMNCRSNSRSSWFLSPTNTPLQGDQKSQQVSCRSRRTTSFARGAGGQDLPASCEKMNCEMYISAFSNKTRG
jgi:hypothetical protein